MAIQIRKVSFTHLYFLGLVVHQGLLLSQGVLELLVALQQRFAQLGGQLEVCENNKTKPNQSVR
jgi:hypothetical protein